MPEPIEYDVLLDLQTALRAISIAGGYHHDVESAAVSVDPHDEIEILTGQLAHNPYFTISVSPGRTLQYQPAMQVLEVIPVDITAAADATALVATSRLQTFQRLCADVEQALAVDITRGARAVDTRVLEKSMGMMVGGTRVIAAIQAEVRLYRTYGEPNG